MHSETTLYYIRTTLEQQFIGTVDGSIAPFAHYPQSAGRNSAIVFQHKQSEAQKQAYRDKHPETQKVIHQALNPYFGCTISLDIVQLLLHLASIFLGV